MSPAQESLLIASLLELEVPAKAVPKIVKRIAQEERDKEYWRDKCLQSMQITNDTLNDIEGILNRWLFMKEKHHDKGTIQGS